MSTGSQTLPSQRGFTLLEVLVALALMAAISIGLVSSIHWSQEAQARTQQAQLRAEEIRTLRGFLLRTLQAAYPFDPEPSLGHAVGPLSGDAVSLSFTGPSSGGASGTGWMRYELRIEREGDGSSRLLARWSVDPKGDSASSDRVGNEEVLAEGLQSLEWSYCVADEEGGAATWHDRWENSRRLPQQIRLQLHYADAPEEIVDLRVVPRITDDAQCAFDPVSETCREVGA